MRSLDSTNVDGDTALFDAVSLAATKLEEYCNSSNLEVKKRIIVLSDGEDNKSKQKIDELTKTLINHNIVVDSFLVSTTTIVNDYKIDTNKSQSQN